MEDKKELNIQEELKRLDEIIEKISSKALPLEESLALYEEGVKITKTLEQALKEAEEKVEKIVNIK